MDSASRQARLMVVEDHPVVALGLINIFSDEPDLQVVAQASSSREALKMIGQENPDLVIVPMRLDGELAGLGLSQRIKERRPGTKVLILVVIFRPRRSGWPILVGPIVMW
ncbi:response regulator transcription factor [Auritidibacter ignavus]|uniref:Response regulator transcription factor n=1 Tax=Auritidibacter ignavus TaxID=678932 RepID=A0AAJ6DEH8_9MICC|nr:response regulator transcription factor [Auritidibacter ignavus]WGH92623.1 response regulator transcription factor [Auritidibacter ignavus]WHS29000.1 response regulator transcription factor [Auritidibacter ignavus]